MPQIESSQIAAIKERADVRSIVQETVRLRRSGHDYLGLCPFHQEKTPSLHVKEKYYKCFGCGASGDIFAWVIKIHGLSFADAVQFVADRVGYVVTFRVTTPFEDSVERQRRAQAMQIAESARLWHHQLLHDIGIARAVVDEAGIEPWEDPARELGIWEYKLSTMPITDVVKLYLEKRRVLPEATARLVNRGRIGDMVIRKSLEFYIETGMLDGLFEPKGGWA